MYLLSQCINLYFIDDHCQYWFNMADGTLTSPNFGVNDLGNYQFYDHNLNCIWILDSDQGYYITLEIDYFDVTDDNDTKDIYLHNFSNTVHNSSLILVTISQSIMDQISNQYQYQSWMEISIIIKKAFQVQDLTCWFY